MDSSGKIHALTDPEITDEQLAKHGLTPIPKEDEVRVQGMTLKERLAWLAQERVRLGQRSLKR